MSRANKLVAFASKCKIQPGDGGSASLSYEISKTTLRSIKDAETIAKFEPPSGKFSLTEDEASVLFWASAKPRAPDLNPCAAGCGGHGDLPKTVYFWFSTVDKRYQLASTKPCKAYVPPQAVLLP